MPSAFPLWASFFLFFFFFSALLGLSPPPIRSSLPAFRERRSFQAAWPGLSLFDSASNFCFGEPEQQGVSQSPSHPVTQVLCHSEMGLCRPLFGQTGRWTPYSEPKRAQERSPARRGGGMLALCQSSSGQPGQATVGRGLSSTHSSQCYSRSVHPPSALPPPTPVVNGAETEASVFFPSLSFSADKSSDRMVWLSSAK